MEAGEIARIAEELSERERETLRIAKRGAIWMNPGMRERLTGLGLVDVLPPKESWHEANYQVTDLGRAVAKELE